MKITFFKFVENVISISNIMGLNFTTSLFYYFFLFFDEMRST